MGKNLLPFQDTTIFTTSPAAQFLGRSETFIKRAALRGELPCVLSSNGRRFFLKSDLEKYLRKSSLNDSQESQHG